MKKLTIGYVLDDNLDKSDGVQQAVINIGEHMRSLGHDVHYIVANTKRTDLKNIHSVAKYVSLRFNGNSVRTPLPASRKAIKELFREVNFDVLHVQMPHGPLLGSKVLKMAPKGVKKVGTFHILPYNMFSTLGTRALGLVMKRSTKDLDTAFAVSPPALEFMKSHFKLDGTVLGNPIDHKYFSSFRRQKSAKTKIVFVGRFDKRKGVVQLIKAFAKLSEATRSSVELKMCGKGPLLNICMFMSTQLGLGIEFPGYITDDQKGQYLSDADIAVFPSISGESFGIVLTEAMSAGADITIGGNNPGYSSVLEAWPLALFDPTNIDELSRLLQKLIESKGLRDSVGKQQHQDVKKYDVDLIVSKLLDCYR